jgi:hypothetical protein
MSIRRSSRTLAATFVVASLTASPAIAQDKRSPDAQDAARHAAPATIDPRSPDAVDAARQAAPATIDPRSPDAIDAARPTPDLRVTASLAGPPGNPPAVVTTPPAGDGFDWVSAGIGGAGVVLVALAGGVTVASRRRRIAAA